MQSVSTRERKNTGDSTKAKLTRAEKGVRLAGACWQEIVKVRSWTWSVPSETEPDVFYVADIRNEVCSCPDSRLGSSDAKRSVRDSCKHIHAVRHLIAITSECADCKERHPHRDMIEVADWHESLTWFEGDILCRLCAHKTGIL